MAVKGGRKGPVRLEASNGLAAVSSANYCSFWCEATTGGMRHDPRATAIRIVKQEGKDGPSRCRCRSGLVEHDAGTPSAGLAFVRQNDTTDTCGWLRVPPEGGICRRLQSRQAWRRRIAIRGRRTWVTWLPCQAPVSCSAKGSLGHSRPGLCQPAPPSSLRQARCPGIGGQHRGSGTHSIWIESARSMSQDRIGAGLRARLQCDGFGVPGPGSTGLDHTDWMRSHSGYRLDGSGRRFVIFDD